MLVTNVNLTIAILQLCAERFKAAYENNADQKVVLEAINEKALETISMDVLLKHAYFKGKV